MRCTWLLACAASVFLATPASGSDFRDSKYGYTVSAPEFSTPREGDSFPRLVINGPPDGGFGPNMNVMVQEIKTTRDAFIALSEKQFAAAGLSMKSSKKREVSGSPAVLTEYVGQMRGRDLHFLSLAVVLPERVILVTYTASAAAFSGLEAEFRRSLESFKLSAK